MEVEEEDSDEDDILEIESLTKEDKECMHNIERLIIEERINEHRNGTAIDTKRTRMHKRNLKRQIENVMVVITNGSVVAVVNNSEVSNLEIDHDNDIGVAQNRRSVIASRTVCEDSSEETSSEEEEDDEDDEKVEDGGDEEETNEKEEGGDMAEEDDNDDDDNSDDNDVESEEEETESRSIYSSISTGLWNSHLCTKGDTNQTECASMSFPDALHIIKKDAGFTGTGKYKMIRGTAKAAK